MTPKQFVESLDIRNDFRTYWNFCKIPFILFIHAPLVLFLWFLLWCGDYIDSSNLSNEIWGWVPYTPKRKEI